MSTKTNLATLVYDEKARAEFFAGYDILIEYSKKYGYLNSAMDLTKKRNEILSEVNLLVS